MILTNLSIHTQTDLELKILLFGLIIFVVKEWLNYVNSHRYLIPFTHDNHFRVTDGTYAITKASSHILTFISSFTLVIGVFSMHYSFSQAIKSFLSLMHSSLIYLVLMLITLLGVAIISVEFILSLIDFIRVLFDHNINLIRRLLGLFAVIILLIVLFVYFINPLL